MIPGRLPRIAAANRASLWLPIPLLLAAVVHARGFGGYWLGDDFTNLHTFSGWAEQGRLWSESLARFWMGISAEGSAYRPLSILSLAANQWLAGDWYPGWYLPNYLVHLCNGLLLWILLGRLAPTQEATGRAPLAALAVAFFLLSPLIAEAVYWVSARADGWVCLLTLLALILWLDGGRRLLLVPVLLGLALAFKESAAVFPLQMLMLAWALPRLRDRSRLATLLVCIGLTAAFLLLRACLFGSAWHVYAEPGQGGVQASIGQLLAALLSIGPWWSALSVSTPWAAMLYALGLAGSVLLLSRVLLGPHWRLVLALAAAGGGLVLATLLNLGTLQPHGEGGRLFYGPYAWAALTLGTTLAVMPRDRLRAVSACLLLVTVLIGARALERQISEVRKAQTQVRELVAALPSWVEQHQGLTLLLVAERRGHVVTTRNAQGALASPPLQKVSLLGRILPMLPADLATRHEQLAQGMATHFARLQPRLIDLELARQMAEAVEPTWPEHYACWSTRERRIRLLATVDPADPAAWRAELQPAFAACACADPQAPVCH